MHSTLWQHASLKYLKMFALYRLRYALGLAWRDHHFKGLCVWDNR
jgi:hypothetical protein